jgi:hypothetical protein
MLFPSQVYKQAPVNWQIGRRAKGQRPDVHPSVVMDLTTIAQVNDDGSTSRIPAAYIVSLVTAQEENGGHKYLRVPKDRNGQPRPIPLAYLWPRAIATADGESLMIAGLDDFDSVEDIQLAIQEAEAEFLASDPEPAAAETVPAQTKASRR